MLGFELKTFRVLYNSLTSKRLPQFFQLHFERKNIFYTDIQPKSYPTATGLTILGLTDWIAFILWNG